MWPRCHGSARTQTTAAATNPKRAHRPRGSGLHPRSSRAPSRMLAAAPRLLPGRGAEVAAAEGIARGLPSRDGAILWRDLRPFAGLLSAQSRPHLGVISRQASESDRRIAIKKPKHLFSGKRGMGKTDRR